VLPVSTCNNNHRNHRNNNLGSGAQVVVAADGTGSEFGPGLVGFVSCGVVWQRHEPISTAGSGRRRVLSGDTRACLSHDGDRGCMPIQVQQVLGQGARRVLRLSHCGTESVSQSDDERGGLANLLDRGQLTVRHRWLKA
jgi:hypothetical protein